MKTQGVYLPRIAPCPLCWGQGRVMISGCLQTRCPRCGGRAIIGAGTTNQTIKELKLINLIPK